MRQFQTKDSAIAKLVSFSGTPSFYPSILNPIALQFAKHMKIEEQITYLKNKKTGIGVGTPARLADLIENGMHANLCRLFLRPAN